MTRVLVSGVVLDQAMGGVRRHNQELLPRVASLLAREGGELCVLAPRKGLAFDPGPETRVAPSSVPSGPPALRALAESRAIALELRSAEAEGRPYDVVHAAHLPAPRVPRELRARVRRTHTVHDLRALELEDSGLLRRVFAEPMLARALRETDKVIAVSETMRGRLRERFDLSEERCVLVPNAGDHLVPLPRRPRPDSPLLHVGHLEPRKNLELVIYALALAPDLPPLLLAGAAKGDMAARLAARARELGVGERVRLLGAVTERELCELYAEAACVVIPSRLEGFGIGVLEAQLARAPLAISSAGALREVAGEPTPAFEPDDADACVRAIREALGATIHELDQAARRAARFSWDESARRFHAVLAGREPGSAS